MIGVKKLLALWVLVMGLCVVAPAQAPAPTPKKTDEPVTGAIDGRVVNESGQPMAGASLFVRTVNSIAFGRTTTTDVDGNFRVNGLEPGLYTISANAPAYTTPPSDPYAPTYYRVGDTVRVELIRGGAITGAVTNSSGEPVIGVRVRATMVRDAGGQLPKSLAGVFMEQSTDDRGIYRIYGLATGTYIVSAGGSGFSSTFNPYDTDVPTFAPSATRDNAAEVSVRSGEDTNVDIRYRGEPGHTISGTAKATGTSGSSIMLTPAGSFIPLASTYQIPGSRGFAFNGLADGDYDVVAQEVASGATSAMPLLALSEPKRVTIKGADVTGIEVSTRLLSWISGRIALEPTKAPECQGKRPPLLAETVVQVRRPEKEIEKQDSLTLRTIGSSASPDGNGAFVLNNLIPGRYQLEPRFYARYWFLQSITINSGGAKPQKIDAAASWTTVKSGEKVSNLTITIAEGAASIHGSVPLPEGAALPAGMTVYLIPNEPDKAEDVLRYFVTSIAADGTFGFNNVPPGKYLAFTQNNPDVQLSTPGKAS